MRSFMEFGRFTLVVLALALCSHARAQQPSSAPPQPAPAPTSGLDGAKPLFSDAVAPGIKPEALWDGRQIMPFRSLDAPRMVSVPEADFLDDTDYILGVTASGQSRAYPTRFVWWHHAINDTLGDPQAGGESPIAVTYCSVCNTGICYDPCSGGTQGKPVMLDFYGLCNGVVALCDRDTGSVFPQAGGRFVTGALTGTTLKTLPLLDTTWGEWKRLHPATLVMSPDTPYGKFYNPRGKPEPRGYDWFPAPFFRPTVTQGDKRLPAFAKVLAVTLSVPVGQGKGAAQEADSLRVVRRAYPLATLQQRGCVVNDKLGRTPIAVFLDPNTMSAVAVYRKLDQRTLSFEARKQSDGRIAIYDKQTRTRWNIEGRAEEGLLAGKVLDRVENHLSQWYGWAAFYPDTSIFGRRDAPQPGDPFETNPTAPEKKETKEYPPF